MTRKRMKKLLMARLKSRNRVEQYIKKKSGLPNAEIYASYCRELDELMRSIERLILYDLAKATQGPKEAFVMDYVEISLNYKEPLNKLPDCKPCALVMPRYCGLQQARTAFAKCTSDVLQQDFCAESIDREEGTRQENESETPDGARVFEE